MKKYILLLGLTGLLMCITPSNAQEGLIPFFEFEKNPIIQKI